MNIFTRIQDYSKGNETLKKALSLILALAIAAGCLCIVTTASADLETWYVKAGDGKGLNVRDRETGEKITSLPYSSAVRAVPDTRTGTARLRWAPSKKSTLRMHRLLRGRRVRHNHRKCRRHLQNLHAAS